jgi:hypothetical protein
MGIIAAAWQSLNDDEKKKYEDMSKVDANRRERQL